MNVISRPVIAQAASRPDLGERQWIYHPALDLTVGCGAWSAPLLLCSYLLGAETSTAMMVAFYALTLLFNNPHYMATLYRAYHRRDDFSKYKIFTLHLTALLLVAAALTHWARWLLPWIFTLYITWSPWHYAGQNFGLAMMFAHRNGAKPTRRERNALFAAFTASYLMLFVSFHSGPSADPYVLSLGLPEGFAKSARITFLPVFLFLAGYALLRMARQTRRRAIVPAAMLVFTQFLWFALPTILELMFGLKSPQTRYSSGLLAFMHSAQYLWVTGFYARREAQAAGQQDWRWRTYFATLIIGGIALFVPGPWLVSYAFHFDFSESFLIFAALVNIHHFILDGAIWKLRDRRIASLLLDTREKLAGGAGEASAAFGRATRWLTGPSSPARALRLATAAVLLVLAGLDQARNYLALDDRRLSSLARAEALNPYDAKVHLRIARGQSRAGNLEERIAALRRAISINPYNAEAQNTLAQVYLENRRYAEAQAHYEQMLARLPAEAGALFNYAVLLNQAGRAAEAIENWRKAVAVDPNNRMAHFYLAEAYGGRQELATAIPHYEQYLTLLTAQPTGQKVGPQEALYVATRLADLYGRLRQPDRALSYCEQAVNLAAQAGEARFESLALSQTGALFAASGRRGEAARCYQRALRLDAAAGDAQAEGVDWFNYGQFLRQGDAPARLVYACLLKAEEMLKNLQAPESETVVKARREVEAAAGKEAAVVRQDLKAATAEALALRF